MLDSLTVDIYQVIEKGVVDIVQGLTVMKNPVDHYLSGDKIKDTQYMVSRIFSILHYYKKEGISTIHGEELNWDIRGLEEEILKRLVEYPQVLGDVAQTGELEKLIKYLLELTQSFYGYHQGIQFRRLEKERLLVVLKLLEGIHRVALHIMGLFGIEAPEKM